MIRISMQAIKRWRAALPERLILGMHQPFMNRISHFAFRQQLIGRKQSLRYIRRLQIKDATSSPPDGLCIAERRTGC